MVGFNRRFAPMLTDLRRRFGDSVGPSILRYSVSAGRLAPDSWYRNAELEGSRFVGEGGHFVDTVSWWLGARPSEVFAMRGPDFEEVEATLRFDDGSVAALSYTTSGSPRAPKETLEVDAAGRTARLDNFRRTTLWTGRRRSTRPGHVIDKGQREQLAAFLQAVRDGAPMPIPLSSVVETTAATLAIDRSLHTGLPERP
jgi:predicted dehydrogenase